MDTYYVEVKTEATMVVAVDARSAAHALKRARSDDYDEPLFVGRLVPTEFKAWLPDQAAE